MRFDRFLPLGGKAALRIGLLGLALPLAGCDLSVVNPGRIRAEDLDTPEAGEVVLVGLVSSIEDAADALALHTGLASGDEITFSGTRSWLYFFSNGELNPIDAGFAWNPASEARWAAEQGAARLRASQENPGQSPLVAAALMWAGFANRMMGDTFCEATFDGGPAEPNSAYYERAIGHFEEARTIAQAVGPSADSIRLASIAGMAQAHLVLGNYTEAAALAAQVPDDFVWTVRYGESGREDNLLWSETYVNSQYTAFDTPLAALGPDLDPRAPWEDMKRLGAGGTVPFYRQKKYPGRGSDIPLAKGTEMRLIQAEAALRGGDVAGAVARINEVRAAAGVPAVGAATADAAWDALIRERYLTLWLEGRRLKDNQRFFEEGRSDVLEGRAKCFPFSDAEINSNPNLRS